MLTLLTTEDDAIRQIKKCTPIKLRTNKILKTKLIVLYKVNNNIIVNNNNS